MFKNNQNFNTIKKFKRKKKIIELSMDAKTSELLVTYRKEVEKLARGVYLQVMAAKKELDSSKVNPEDKQRIILHCISLLAKQESSDNG
jgi:hypothetical protein